MPNLELVTTMKNTTSVYVDLANSHASTHIKEHPELLEFAKDFLKVQEFHEEEVAIQHDVGHSVGTADLVETSDKDEIVYAKRLNRDSYTRFAKNRKTAPTPFITMVLRKNPADGSYELWSIWIGPKVPPFPGDDRETEDSLSFWKHHALVWGNQAIQKGSETTASPW
jgi:hypothetical protein